MSFLDFSDAGNQRGGVRGIIPEGALAIGRFKVHPYSEENNTLSKVGSTGNKSIEAEFEIIGPDAYIGVKVYEYFTLEGKDNAVAKSRSRVKAMCEARGADPEKYPDGYKVPMMPNKDPDLRIFDGHEFPIQVGVEDDTKINPQTGRPYGKKNRIRKVLSPIDPACDEQLKRLVSEDYDPPALLPIEEKPAAPAAAPGANPFAGRTPPTQQASTPAPAAPPPLRPAGPPATSAPSWLPRR